MPPDPTSLVRSHFRSKYHVVNTLATCAKRTDRSAASSGLQSAVAGRARIKREGKASKEEERGFGQSARNISWKRDGAPGRGGERAPQRPGSARPSAQEPAASAAFRGRSCSRAPSGSPVMLREARSLNCGRGKPNQTDPGPTTRYTHSLRFTTPKGTKDLRVRKDRHGSSLSVCLRLGRSGVLPPAPLAPASSPADPLRQAPPQHTRGGPLRPLHSIGSPCSPLRRVRSHQFSHEFDFWPFFLGIRERATGQRDIAGRELEAVRRQQEEGEAR